MPARLAILNGPNLNLLGVREPEIYGATTLQAIEASCCAAAQVLGVELEFHQTNSEGRMIDLVQGVGQTADALIINPAGLSFLSLSLRDALQLLSIPIIELHLSNIHARDIAHRHSQMPPVATAVICGLGAYGYIIAMQAAARLLGPLPDALPTPLRLGPK